MEIHHIRHSYAANILVVDDTPESLDVLMQILTQHGYKVRIASSGQLALKSAQMSPPDLILLDVKMPEMDGYQVCEYLKRNEQTRKIPVIFISGLDDLTAKIKSFSVGGMDYITKPFHPEEVLVRVETHLTLQQFRNHLQDLVTAQTAELHKSLKEIQRLKDQLQAENFYLREEIKLEHNFEEIIGQSHLLQYLLFKVEQVAPTDTMVLILGETGTGKELIARAIHHTSPRRDRPLVKVNCAVLPAHLIESELFGHEKGAFTGAQARQIGRFELAQGTTLFLDEIGELPLELQAKLLRVLQDGEFERLGNPRTIKVDTRVIAATNRDLKAEVQAGRFRRDLYYRLSKYPLTVPPLRERREDIPLLMQTFVEKFSKKLGKQIERIPQHTLRTLQNYPWPGNIRELENLIERAVILSQDATLHIELPENIDTSRSAGDPSKTLEEVERDYIIQILETTHWKINGEGGAAVILGLHPSTLRSRLKKLGIRRTTGMKDSDIE